MAECYCRHAGVIEPTCTNAVIDTEEQEECQEKTSEVSITEARREKGKSAPSLPYPRDVRQVGGRTLNLCNPGFFAYGYWCTPRKEEISLPLHVGNPWVGGYFCQCPINLVHRFLYQIHKGLVGLPTMRSLSQESQRNKSLWSCKVSFILNSVWNWNLKINMKLSLLCGTVPYNFQLTEPYEFQLLNS